MHPPAGRHVRLGPFEADLQVGELRVHGRKLKLPEQSLQILALLAERPGEVVTREVIRQKLWPQGTFVDFEHSINTAIKRLREALGDDAEHPRFIETLPRHGYRLVAAVEPLTPDSFPAGRAAARRPVALVAGGILALAAVLFALNVAGLRRDALRAIGVIHASPPPIRSIAVLPLENLSGDPKQEYFADGMTDELITTLGRISALRVISHTSVIRYKGTQKPLPEIARELNVDAIIEGSVVRSGNRVRITANLVQAPGERHLWAETYERDLGDVLALQDEVARDVANEIRVKLTPQEQTRLASSRPVNPEAYELYLKGRYESSLRTEEGLRKSTAFFQQALKLDPAYAVAYAGLADTYVLVAESNSADPREAYPRAKGAATKAVELDETLGEAHVPLGAVESEYDWNWRGAEKEFRRAIELNPSSANAHRCYARHLMRTGRFDEAVREIERARELDPASPAVNGLVGWILIVTRRTDEGIAQERRTLELNPDFFLAHYYLAYGYMEKKLYDQAISEFLKAQALQRDSTLVEAGLACAYAAAGRRAEALGILSRLRRSQKYVSPFDMALIYVNLGDSDQAFAWLEKAYQEHSFYLAGLKASLTFSRFRSDPRYQDLLRRMNFPP